MVPSIGTCDLHDVSQIGNSVIFEWNRQVIHAHDNLQVLIRPNLKAILQKKRDRCKVQNSKKNAVLGS
jgi:hypothetical protein